MDWAWAGALEHFVMARVIARLMLAAAGLVLGASALSAATIKSQTITLDSGEPLTIISIEGELQIGDDQKFANEAIRASKAVVLLNSLGGSTMAGIEIGKAIRLKGFATLVLEELVCTSACGLAWLGGVPRMMSENARVGFHATYVTESGHPEVSAVGNAAVGAYLNQLGLPLSAIAYVSEAKPTEIKWLTFADAKHVGLEVEPFTETANAAAAPSAPARKPGAPHVDWAAEGGWIQLYSRVNFADAVLLAEGLAGGFPNVSVFVRDNGAYVVAVGPYPTDVAQSLRDLYVAAKSIPRDSAVNPGSSFVDKVWPADAVASGLEAKPAPARGSK